MKNHIKINEEMNHENNDKYPINSLETSYDYMLIDEITSKYGYGKEIWKSIICSVMIISVSGYFTTLFSSTIIAFEHLYNLNNNHVMLIATIFFIFKILGSILVGYIVKIISRIVLINTNLLFLSLLSLIFSFIYDNYTFFIFFRIISGFLCGNIETLITNILCEHLPIKFRGLTLTSIWTGWSIGQLIPNLIMLIYTPNFEFNGLGKILFISTIIPLITFIICMLYLKDSPRNYIMNNRYDEAFKIIRS